VFGDPKLLCFNEESSAGSAATDFNGVHSQTRSAPRHTGEIRSDTTRSTTTGAPVRRPIRTSCYGGTTTSSWSDSFDSGVTRFGASGDWARSAQITSSAAAASSSGHQAPRFHRPGSLAPQPYTGLLRSTRRRDGPVSSRRAVQTMQASNLQNLIGTISTAVISAVSIR